MPKLQGKTWLYVGAGAIVLFLVYRWYQNQQANSAAGNTGAVDTSGSGSDYGQLAGQEQGDVAALSGQEASDVSALQSGLASATGQEQTDIGGVNAALAAASGQEQSDVAGLQSDIQGVAASQLSPSTIQGQFGSLFPGETAKVNQQQKQIANLTKELAKVMAGEKKQGGHSKTAGKTTQHAKGGTAKGKSSSSPHANANHRNGTASKAVANRSHAPKRARR